MIKNVFAVAFKNFLKNRLFSLTATFNVERRTKEIGIRKVMGAEVREIVTLLLPLCAVAGLLALLIAWLTVAGNTVKAAGMRPVYSLRYE